MTGVSLNFELDYKLLNEKMAEFLDNHSDEINAIVGQCFRVSAPDPIQRKKEINGSISSNIPDEPFANLFNNGGK